MIHIGWINLYKYDTGRLHVGTGVYADQFDAEYVGSRKRRFVKSVPVSLEIDDLGEFRKDEAHSGFRFKRTPK